jgi:hypothetical protein
MIGMIVAGRATARLFTNELPIGVWFVAEPKRTSL